MLIQDGQSSSSCSKLESDCLFNISSSYSLHSDEVLSFSLLQVLLQPLFSRILLTFRTEFIHLFCFLRIKIEIVITRSIIKEIKVTFLYFFIIQTLMYYVDIQIQMSAEAKAKIRIALSASAVEHKLLASRKENNLSQF